MNKVLYYSGNKINETPRGIIVGGKVVDVYLFEEVIEENFLTRERKKKFIVYDREGNKYKIEEGENNEKKDIS